jgi:hypothetical protein
MIWKKEIVYTAKRGKWELRIVRRKDGWHYVAWHSEEFENRTSDAGYSSPTHAQEACIKAIRRRAAGASR